MTENEAIKIFNDLLDVPCEMLIKYDSVINSEKKQELVRLRTAEELAIQALEKQIPKKPVNYDKHYYKCPCCNEDLEIDDDMLFVYDEEPPKFCIKCGQKLDWGEEE